MGCAGIIGYWFETLFLFETSFGSNIVGSFDEF